MKTNFLAVVMCSASFLPLLVGASSAGEGFVRDLPEPAGRLMTDEAAFRPFAESLAAEVARQLVTHPDPARTKLLLGIQVHLADHLGSGEIELATAERIRALQTDPSDRAFAGLTTKAAVAARRSTGEGTDSPRYAAAYGAAFAEQLATLPATPEIVAMLRRQRARNEFSRAALLREAKDQIEPQIAQHGHPTWEDLDQFIRARHRLTDLLPVQAETLQALDEAITVRLRAH